MADPNQKPGDQFLIGHGNLALLAFSALCASALGFVPPLHAAAAVDSKPAGGEIATVSTNSPSSKVDVTRFSLDQLMEMKVTSVSRKPEEFFDAPAALYVITAEDIRRAGALTLPEALRLAPGLDVAQIDASKWAISSRGFNEVLANKLLVLIDGRSVYDPAFSGLYWEAQDLVLQDIDRIEVIRGPGGTLWGANAVNGVINITTKSAKDTQGLYLDAGGGNVFQGIESVRYGGQLAPNAYYRVYEKFVNHSDFYDPLGNSADDWRSGRGGFRVDWDISDANALTAQGDFYRGDFGAKQIIPSSSPPYQQIVAGTARLEGANLLGRLQHTFAEDNRASLQLYYDQFQRDDLRYSEARDTFDLDFQHQFSALDRNEFVYGLGYRFSQDDIRGTYSNLSADGKSVFAFDDPSVGTHLASAFLQDTITLLPDRLHLTLGSKLEHNDFTGLEFQPGTRLLWTPQERQVIWASVARAVRTPSRIDDNLQADLPLPLPGPPYIPQSQGLPYTLRIGGNSQFEDETLIAYELGYRVRPTERITVDVAVFYNDYDHLRLGQIDTSSIRVVPNGYVDVPLTLVNRMKGDTYGAEIVTHWNPTDNWKLTASYSYLQMQLFVPPPRQGIFETVSPSAVGRSPRHQAQLHSAWDLTEKWEVDTGVYYVDDLPVLQVPSYVRWDLGVAWHPAKSVEVRVGVQNLLDDRHFEFGASADNFNLPTEVRRSYYGMVSWRF